MSLLPCLHIHCLLDCRVYAAEHLLLLHLGPAPGELGLVTVDTCGTASSLTVLLRLS